MLQLIKLTSVKHILEVVQSKETFFQLLVGILQLNSKDLIVLFKSLFDSIRQPPSLIRKVKEDKLIKEPAKQQDAKQTEKHQLMLEEQASLKKLLSTLIGHMQNFLKWLIDLGLVPEIAKLQGSGHESSWSQLLQSYSNQRVWLDHLSLSLELYIRANDEAKEQSKSSTNETSDPSKNKAAGGVLEKIPEEGIIAADGIDNDEDDLVPLLMSRSISMPVTPG